MTCAQSVAPAGLHNGHDHVEHPGTEKGECSAAPSEVAPLSTGLVFRERKCRANSCAELRDVLFGGSLPSLVLNLVGDDSVSDADIKALKDALGELEPKK